jgi:hypothetical protein
MSLNDFIINHMFQEDYYQFYILIFLAWLYFEWKFKQLFDHRLTVLVQLAKDLKESIAKNENGL